MFPISNEMLATGFFFSDASSAASRAFWISQRIVSCFLFMAETAVTVTAEVDAITQSRLNIRYFISVLMLML